MKAHSYGSLAVVENSAETDSGLTYPESVLTPPEYLRDLRDLRAHFKKKKLGRAPDPHRVTAPHFRADIAPARRDDEELRKKYKTTRDDEERRKKYKTT